MKQYNWGIIGPGKIAHKFAEGLRAVPSAHLCGVASTSRERAREFAAAYHAETLYDSYEELVRDPAIDVVYVATTNNSHFELARLCMEHGKACLCEKPLCLTLAQYDELHALSQKYNVFLMEALWTRFLPSIQVIDDCIQQGKIGKIQNIMVDFGFEASPETLRLFLPELGGGALFDIGIYPLFLVLHLLGEPQKIEKQIQKTSQGVDIDNEIQFYYNSGAAATMAVSFMRKLPCTAIIQGSEGRIEMRRMWHCPCEIYAYENSGARETITPEYCGNGYNYEIEEVHKCLLEGRRESEKLPFSFSRLLGQYIAVLKE
ncbi:MAG: Gfo/Idh/MocA family oxidoreductase [Bacteroidales bacterium]|jgi:predicted dehydrogenase|nr:Gfo/Idh/MocA family oxidoreductase [Bacteroidales bacterium]